MRLSVTAAVAGLCASAHAFSDSSPFILFSTAKLSTLTSQNQQLQSSSKVLESTKQLLSSCPTTNYLFVSQPNLNAGHLSSKSTPNLSQSLDGATSSYSVAEVAGEFDVKDIAEYIRATCDVPRSAVDVIELTPLPSSAAKSEQILVDNDSELGRLLEMYEASTSNSYTVIYAGGSWTEESQAYTAELTDSSTGHSELKRQHHDFDTNRRQKQIKNKKNPPLFVKYQFFTPAIFMSLIVVIILLSILYSGISALASLQVSYGAFDKDMGPAAQKKQQ